MSGQAAVAFSPSRRRLTALRLAALGIDEPVAATPEAAVRTALATQAQDYLGTLWSVALRTPAATSADVETSHQSGRFVRSWPMRGTLHFVIGEDLPWMLGLTSARMLQTAAGTRRRIGLTDDDYTRAGAVARDRLGGRRGATRAELLDAFEAAGVSTEGQRGYHMLGHLAQIGLLVLAERDTWMLLDEWVPEPRRLERDEALEEFALRYFTSHGPATVKDFAWWSSLTLADARAGLASARDRLEELQLDGTTYYHRPGLEPATGAVHLLPGFDEYLLGYADRTAQLAGEHANTVVPGGNGLFMPTIVVDGEVVGIWKRDRKANLTVVTLAPVRPLTATTMRGVSAKIRRYADFAQTEVELREPAGDPAR
jgi:hypothetical protein